jgi:hypothetical protein
MNDNKLTKNVYLTSKEEYLKNNQNNWCQTIHKLVIKYNLQELWRDERKIFILPAGANNLLKGWYNFVYKKVQEKEETEWLKAMNKQPKLRTYITFKKKLELENYLISETQKEARYNLTSIRTGTNKLRIETGRWKREKKEERTCRSCMSGEIEDEKHFILDCQAYHNLRIDLCNEIKINTHNKVDISVLTREERWQILMNPQNNKLQITEPLKKYTRSSLKLRAKI